MTKKEKASILIIVFILIAAGLTLSIVWQNKKLPVPESGNKEEEVFCTMEAKECPDGSYVGRIPPNCEFAPCPSETIPNDWLTYVDTDRENNISFSYPKDFGKKYIFTEDWPPVVSVINQPYSCLTTDPTSSVANRTIERNINNRLYCIVMNSEGAAGSVYTNYSYITSWQGKLINITFSSRYPQCQNYTEPEQTACVDERQDFDIDALVDQIVSSISTISYDQVGSTMSAIEAKAIAEKNCIKGGESLADGYYNQNTKTWWFDANLNSKQEGCNPACVVNEETKTAEINWRCTGLIIPSETN